MRLAHTSDLHLDERNGFYDTLELMQWLAKDIAAFEPQLTLVCGDSAPVGVRPMTPKERNALADWYVQLAEDAPVVVVRGNHDVADGDIDLFGALRSKHEIHVASRPGVFCPIFKEPVMVGMLPWPSKGYLMSLLRPEDKKGVAEATQEALRGILDSFRVEFSKAANGLAHCVMAAHVNVSGSDAGGFALVGQDVEVSAEELLATGADYIALGHIHKRQNFGARVHFSGSPRRVDFGEEGEVKSYSRVILEYGRLPQVTFRETPIPDMQTIRIQVRPDAEGGTVWDGIVKAGVDLRVIVTVGEENRAMIDERELLRLIGASGAHSCKTEYDVVLKQRVRSPEIQKAVTDVDRLIAYLGTLEPAPSAIVVDRLMNKFLELA